jgi:hypothetical protein
MVLHPDIARWMVLADQQRIAEAVRRSRPRAVTARRRRRLNGHTEGAC